MDCSVAEYIGQLRSHIDFEVFCYFHRTIYGPRRKKTWLQGFGNNTGADQPAHPRSLISAFVIRVLERTISRLATSKISFF